MNSQKLRLAGAAGLRHPVVGERRMRDMLRVGATGLLPLALALAIAWTVPHPNLGLFLAAVGGALAIVFFVVNPRLEVSLGVLALYLGLLNGPVKLGMLGGGESEATRAVGNVLVLAVGVGALLRLISRRDRIRLPPIAGWVIAFVAIVLVEAFNPKTEGILKVLAGSRQQLQFVPFFFFGYAIMRSKPRLRRMFLILGVVALANGLVATYQTQSSPAQLASWGPGYKILVQGVENEAGARHGQRLYISEGVGRVRPMALGSDSGFGGGVGAVTLPCVIALLATWRTRRKWVPVLLCLGALVALATCLGRLQVVAGGLGVLAFVLLAFTANRRLTRPVAALLVVTALALPLGALFVSATGSGTYSRYKSLLHTNPTSECKDCKSGLIRQIPHQIAVAPFGVGLGSVGAAGAFGGRQREKIEGHGVSAETQYNFLADEVGAPGLILWVGFALSLIILAMRRLRTLRDSELRIYLAGAFAPLIAIVIIGFTGPVSASGALGPYFWFVAGVEAYWLAGPGRERSGPPLPRPAKPAAVGVG